DGLSRVVRVARGEHDVQEWIHRPIRTEGHRDPGVDQRPQRHHGRSPAAAKQLRLGEMRRVLYDDHAQFERTGDEIADHSVAVFDTYAPRGPIDGDAVALERVEHDLDGSITYGMQEERLLEIERFLDDRGDVALRKVGSAVPTRAIVVRTPQQSPALERRAVQYPLDPARRDAGRRKGERRQSSN